MSSEGLVEAKKWLDYLSSLVEKVSTTLRDDGLRGMNWRSKTLASTLYVKCLQGPLYT